MFNSTSTGQSNLPQNESGVSDLPASTEAHEQEPKTERKPKQNEAKQTPNIRLTQPSLLLVTANLQAEIRPVPPSTPSPLLLPDTRVAQPEERTASRSFQLPRAVAGRDRVRDGRDHLINEHPPHGDGTCSWLHDRHLSLCRRAGKMQLR